MIEKYMKLKVKIMSSLDQRVYKLFSIVLNFHKPNVISTYFFRSGTLTAESSPGTDRQADNDNLSDHSGSFCPFSGRYHFTYLASSVEEGAVSPACPHLTSSVDTCPSPHTANFK